MQNEPQKKHLFLGLEERTAILAGTLFGWGVNEL